MNYNFKNSICWRVKKPHFKNRALKVLFTLFAGLMLSFHASAEGPGSNSSDTGRARFHGSARSRNWTAHTNPSAGRDWLAWLKSVPRLMFPTCCDVCTTMRRLCVEWPNRRCGDFGFDRTTPQPIACFRRALRLSSRRTWSGRSRNWTISSPINRNLRKRGTNVVTRICSSEIMTVR